MLLKSSEGVLFQVPQLLKLGKGTTDKGHSKWWPALSGVKEIAISDPV